MSCESLLCPPALPCEAGDVPTYNTNPKHDENQTSLKRRHRPNNQKGLAYTPATLEMFRILNANIDIVRERDRGELLFRVAQVLGFRVQGSGFRV